MKMIIPFYFNLNVMLISILKTRLCWTINMVDLNGNRIIESCGFPIIRQHRSIYDILYQHEHDTHEESFFGGFLVVKKWNWTFFQQTSNLIMHNKGDKNWVIKWLKLNKFDSKFINICQVRKFIIIIFVKFYCLKCKLKKSFKHKIGELRELNMI
jgi:hypothetical protein